MTALPTFVIILDKEFDSVPDQWLIRGESHSKDVLLERRKFSGNAKQIPRAEATMIPGETVVLEDREDGQEHRGAIYEVRGRR